MSRNTMYNIFQKNIGKQIEVITKSNQEKLVTVLNHSTKYLYGLVDEQRRQFKLDDILVYETNEQPDLLNTASIDFDSDATESDSDSESPVKIVSSRSTSPLNEEELDMACKEFDLDKNALLKYSFCNSPTELVIDITGDSDSDLEEKVTPYETTEKELEDLIHKDVQQVINEDIQPTVKEDVQSTVNEVVQSIVNEVVQSIVTEDNQPTVTEVVQLTVKEEVHSIVKEDVQLTVTEKKSQENSKKIFEDFSNNIYQTSKENAQSGYFNFFTKFFYTGAKENQADEWELLHGNKDPLDVELEYPNIYEKESNDSLPIPITSAQQLDKEIEEYMYNGFEKSLKEFCKNFCMTEMNIELLIEQQIKTKIKFYVEQLEETMSMMSEFNRIKMKFNKDTQLSSQMIEDVKKTKDVLQKINKRFK
jgi:hypothetical protein